MYNQKVIKHFKDPKNYGKLDNPDGVGKVGNIICGDVMWLYIKVGKNKQDEEIITEIKFETFGCVAAIAASSSVTELAQNNTLDEALKITRDKITESLGGLPPIKVHCSVLAADALSEAIYDYWTRQNQDIPPELEKRHQRIIKERGIIEEKYHDWVKEEEKLQANT